MKMIEIIIAICLFVSGGITGYLLSPKQEINNIKQEQIQTQENYQKVYVIQGQITIVDTKTNINLNVKDLTNLFEKIVITNTFTTNYTNKGGK